MIESSMVRTSNLSPNEQERSIHSCSIGTDMGFEDVGVQRPWHSIRYKLVSKRCGVSNPLPGGVAQLVERVLYHSTRRAVPERSWVQSLLPSTEVEPGFSTFGGMLVPVLQLISPVCKTSTSLFGRCGVNYCVRMG
jgi:hypothetical protein